MLTGRREVAENGFKKDGIDMREYDQVSNLGAQRILRDRPALTDKDGVGHPDGADRLRNDSARVLSSPHIASGPWNRQMGCNAQRSMLQLQQMCGNHFVQRALAMSLDGEGEQRVSPDLERSITSARGRGQRLDNHINAQMSNAFGTDFSGVRVHVGSQADALNRALNARAFTTGRDVFFRHGAYSPGTSAGRELLAHELTHVVQQSGDDLGRGSASRVADETLQPQLSVGRPDDVYEQEADRVARTFMKWEQNSARTRDGRAGLQKQKLEEEKREDMVRSRPQGGHTRVSCQVEEDEESLQTKLCDNVVQRQSSQNPGE